jgi:hypothetical protein
LSTVCTLYSRARRWTESGVAVKPGEAISGGGHGWNGIGTVWVPTFRQCGCQAGACSFFIFPELSKLTQIWKLNMDAITCSQNFQFLHVARTGYYEQFSQLCRHPILNRIRVKNPGTDSTFEFLMNFKRHLNLLEKSDKFSKIPS